MHFSVVKDIAKDDEEKPERLANLLTEIIEGHIQEELGRIESWKNLQIKEGKGTFQLKQTYSLWNLPK
jgi:hypothetical protein